MSMKIHIRNGRLIDPASNTDKALDLFIADGRIVGTGNTPAGWGEDGANRVLDAEKLALAAPDAIVMHPGPMNRGVEIDPAIADGPRSVINDQVEMGVAVRMAVMEALLDPRRNGAAA